jgi:hypothetical protein
VEARSDSTDHFGSSPRFVVSIRGEYNYCRLATVLPGHHRSELAEILNEVIEKPFVIVFRRERKSRDRDSRPEFHVH